MNTPVFVTYDPRTEQWTLKADMDVTLGGRRFTIPAGFVTDLASVPRIAWVAEAPFELGLAAPIVHDWLYRHGGAVVPPGSKTFRQVFTRAEADRALYELAAQDGVWWWRRWVAYKAVRWFGAKAWRATGAY